MMWIGCIRTKNSTDTYDKLREPTFQYWREDKWEPDIVNDAGDAS